MGVIAFFCGLQRWEWESGGGRGERANEDGHGEKETAHDHP
jgi:hypothetical protein